MTQFTDSLYIIHNNPFILAPLFTNFFASLNEEENNYLSSYLLLPLVLKKNRRDFIIKSNKRSSIHTFKGSQERIVGLIDDIQYYKHLTHNSIQHAIDREWLVINDNLSVSVKENQKNLQDNLAQSYTASGKVKNILGNLDVVTIYRLLGVRKI